MNHEDNSSYETDLSQNIIDNFGRPIPLQKLYPAILNLTKTNDESILKDSVMKILSGKGDEEKVWWKQFSENSPGGFITSPSETFYDLTFIRQIPENILQNVISLHTFSLQSRYFKI